MAKEKVAANGKSALVGKAALFTPSEVKSPGPTFRVGVTIIETRRAYGRDEVLVRPSVGTGSAWVRLKSITVL